MFYDLNQLKGISGLQFHLFCLYCQGYFSKNFLDTGNFAHHILYKPLSIIPLHLYQKWILQARGNHYV